MVIWITGMSSAGKTTVGSELCRLWREEESGTVHVDGDVVRWIFDSEQGRPLAHTMEGRRTNCDRIVRLCEALDSQGLNVVCCILCIFNDVVIANRERFSAYYHVDLSASWDSLRARDKKGLYTGGQWDVAGIDQPCADPALADIQFITDASESPHDIARTILKQIGGRT